MTRNELDTQGVATDLRTAARALGLGASTAYQLAAAGEFPVRVLRAGCRYVVPTAGLREVLGIEDAD